MIMRVILLFAVASVLVAPAQQLVQPTSSPTNSAAEQSAADKDSRALNVLLQAMTSMGGVVPADSVATGVLTVTIGSRGEQGTIRLLTRGADECAEHTATDYANISLIYNHNRARRSVNGESTVLALETAVSSQCPEFPLPYIASALNDSRIAVEYLDTIEIAGRAMQHIRIRTITDKPKLAYLTEFSEREVWIDAATHLPYKASFVLHEPNGKASAPVIVWFSDYRLVSGTAYPFSIRKYLNGLPWQTITIQSVAFNVGLPDSEFEVELGEQP